MTVTIPTTTTAAPIEDLDEAPRNSSPESARPAFLAAVRAGRYPALGGPLTVAVTAMDGAGDLERGVLGGQPQGVGPFIQQVAADVLAGKGLPDDFAEAAYLASTAGDRQAASISAVQGVRRLLDLQFPAVVARSLPELLGGLSTQLDEVMRELRDVDKALGTLGMTSTPEAIAAATDKQRAALLAFADLQKRYNLVRYAQTTALQASGVKPPSVTEVSVGLGWAEVFASGVHEFSDVARRGLPPAHGQPAQRFRALARRADVWLPTVDELAKAWDKLHPRPQVRPAPVPAYNSLLKVSA